MKVGMSSLSKIVMSLFHTAKLLMYLTIIILVLFGSFTHCKKDATRIVMVKEYVGCPIQLPFIQGIKISIIGKGLLAFNGDLNITQDIGNITLITVKVDRCRSAADMESCEYFTSAKYKNPCPMINAKGEMWSEPFEHLNPRLVCPMKKGQYVLTNATMDSSMFASFPGLDGYYWRAKTKIYKDDWLVSCFKMGISIERLRMRNN